MGKRCVVAKCSNSSAHGFTFHCFPSDKSVARKWHTFVNITRKWNVSLEEAIKSKSTICSEHFTLDCYSSSQLMQKRMGYATKLALLPGSTPSILPKDVPTSTETPTKKSNRETTKKKLELARLKAATEREEKARRGLQFKTAEVIEEVVEEDVGQFWIPEAEATTTHHPQFQQEKRISTHQPPRYDAPSTSQRITVDVHAVHALPTSSIPPHHNIPSSSSTSSHHRELPHSVKVEAPVIHELISTSPVQTPPYQDILSSSSNSSSPRKLQEQVTVKAPSVQQLSPSLPIPSPSHEDVPSTSPPSHQQEEQGQEIVPDPILTTPAKVLHEVQMALKYVPSSESSEDSVSSQEIYATPLPPSPLSSLPVDQTTSRINPIPQPQPSRITWRIPQKDRPPITPSLQPSSPTQKPVTERPSLSQTVPQQPPSGTSVQFPQPAPSPTSQSVESQPESPTLEAPSPPMEFPRYLTASDTPYSPQSISTIDPGEGRQTIGLQTDITLPDMNRLLPPADPMSDSDVPLDEDKDPYTDDPDYQQSEESASSSSSPRKKPRQFEKQDKTRIYMVFEEMLLQLFVLCFRCRSPAKGEILDLNGTCVTVKQVCMMPDCKGFTWVSQPLFKHFPLGNVLLSTAILTSGSTVAKTLRLFRFMNVQRYHFTTFYRHQRELLHGSVLSVWRETQKKLLESCGKKLVIGGDARCDSMGHCAKFGSYSFLDCLRNKLLCVELVQKNEVASSYHMELQGLIRCKDKLTSYKQIEDITLVTDRHPQINKWIREKWPEITHYFDIWHIAKGFSKKLDALVKKYPVLKTWARSIVNHIYWCATTSGGNAKLVIAKWTSMANHVINRHSHDSEIFKECAHGPIETPKLWLKPDSRAYEELVDLMKSTRLLKDLGKMSPLGQTGNVEGYHSLVNHFAPKMLHFSYPGMKSRILLAALHYNENCARDYAKNKEGDDMFVIQYPRAKGHQQPVVRQLKAEATYEYAELVKAKVMHLIENTTEAKKLESEIKESTPPAPTAGIEKEDKAVLIEKHKSRFAMGTGAEVVATQHATDEVVATQPPTDAVVATQPPTDADEGGKV